MALCSDRMSTLLSTQDQIAAFEAATKLSTLLRQRDFPKFWSTLRSEEIYSSSFSPALESLPSFSALVRKSIAKSIAETFRSLSRSRAETWLGFSEDEKSKGENLDKFAKETMGWTVDGDSVQIPSNEANDPKATVTSETVDLSREFPSSGTM
jgi:translation initiation factor 3 subunit K